MHFPKSIQLAKFGTALALLGGITTAPTSAIDVVYGYETNWIDPFQESIYTSSLDKVRAELLVDEPIFDTTPQNASGQLKIFSHPRTPFVYPLRGKNRAIEGPWLTRSEKDEPIAVIDVVPPDRPGVTNPGQTAFAFMHDGQASGYNKVPYTKPRGDLPGESSPITGVRYGAKRDLTVEVQFSNIHGDKTQWSLRIKKGTKTLVFGPMKTDDLGKGVRNGSKEPTCFGPYVRSLDGTGDPQIDLRYSVWEKKGSGISTFYFERIFFYDRFTRNFKQFTQNWGENDPRFADLKHDGRPRFVTEDWQLLHDAFNEFGGPIQIWEWTRLHRLVNVTHQFPEEIKKHAKACLKRIYEDGDVTERQLHQLLSYYGDLCLIGEKEKVTKELSTTNKPDEKEIREKVLAELKAHHYI